MPLKNSYAVWNNKGGVGKSTITFHVAARYAETHPTEKVLVVDMCPQANVSMMLLGGGNDGEDRVLDLCTQPTPRTVVGYISTVLANGPGAQLPLPSTFLTLVKQYNGRMPDNLLLLCGDGNLEPMAPLISAQAAAAPLTPTANPWRWVHETLRRLVQHVAETSAEPVTVFVDTNPSFSIYTEIAISSVDKLIVPINADDSSRVATTAMFTLIHGTTPPHPIYGAYTFATKANAAGLSRPQVHLIVGNRLTQNLGPARAFGAISDATAESLFTAFQTHPGRFSQKNMATGNVAQFRDAYSVPLRDFNTAGVVAAHRGVSLSALAPGQYPVYGETVTIDGRRVEECSKAIDAVVARV